MSEENKDQKKFMCGFAIFVDEAGNLFLETNTEAFNVPVARPASLREVRRFASEVLMDINAQSAAEYTIVKLSSLQAKDGSDS